MNCFNQDTSLVSDLRKSCCQQCKGFYFPDGLSTVITRSVTRYWYSFSPWSSVILSARNGGILLGVPLGPTGFRIKARKVLRFTNCGELKMSLFGWPRLSAKSANSSIAALRPMRVLDPQRIGCADASKLSYSSEFPQSVLQSKKGLWKILDRKWIKEMFVEEYTDSSL